MKQKFLAGLSAKGVVLKTWLLSCLFLIVGTGVTWGADPDYTLDTTLEANKGKDNTFAGAEDVTVDKIIWNVTGNATMTPWRLGGKSISNVDRAVYSKTAYTNAVSKIDLTVGAASSITVNSLKLVYSTNSDFSNSSEISKTFAANSTISFEGNFPANAYYKFVFNVTVSGSNNKFVEFSKVEFYNATGGGGSTPTALSAPTNLSSSNVTTTSATLSWDAVANASSYTVKIGDTEHTGVTTTSYSATGLTASTQYTWTVKAVGDGTNYSTSDYAANANFTTEAEQGGGGDDGTTVTFDNLGYTSWGKSASFSGSTYDELSQTKNDVVFDYTRGSGSTYANTTSIRFYKDNQLKFTAPDGYKITSIEWTGSSFKNDVTTDVETCTSTTSGLSWSGNASSVTFTRPSRADSYATLSSVTITLEADATKYDVKFYVGGEEQTDLAQKVVEGGNPTAVTEPTTKTGYTFDGWYENSDFSGDKIADVTSVTISADKNFYGRFNVINYTITYNNVADANHSNPATYTIETATINLADASKEGYIFQGWYDNENCEGEAVTTIAQGSTGNKTFWAKWVEVPANPSTVTFNVGEHGTCETASATEETVGAGVALPEVTANEGWVFKGWSTENPATAETIVSVGDDGKYHILANTTLYAYYKVKPATPTFSSEAGAIEKDTEVTISCTTEGASIYYTTNGNEPTAESTAYTAAIAVNAEQTIKAIAILDEEQSEVASAAYTIATHTARFSINGVITDANNCTVAKGETITFPADPTAPEEHVFIGWKKGGQEITTPQAAAIATVDKATEVMGEEDVTYYAVWAVGSGSGDATWNKVTDASTLSENDVIAIVSSEAVDYNIKGSTTKYNGYIAMGKTQNNNNRAGVVVTVAGDVLTINDDVQQITLTKATFNENTDWQLGVNGGYLYANNSSNNNLKTQEQNDVNGLWNISIENGKATIYAKYSSYTRNYIRVNGNYANSTQNSPLVTAYKSDATTGVLASIYKKISGSSYSDYSTKVSLDPKPTIELSATELAEYAGNTNTSITASVNEDGYTGELSVESSAEAVATASISEGTITINALTAGSATITVTAPAVTGFRKNTATIAVTVSEKLAHGLSFSTDVLNLTVGNTEFSEPTLNNPNSLPIVYSLLYATPANEGKVATIHSETGKITLADPSLSTETQGAVTVKAHTDGDNSHAAGEVTYNLVVARKVTTTSWSNEGAAVTIDKDEIATLPTASNSAKRNIQYESSNTGVATIDNTGAVAFVAYGTTTITAKTSATAEYAATSTAYELTFAPRYTVTFKVFGEEDVVLREETTGAGVTAPTVDKIDDYVFRGWAEAEIDGTTDDAPTFVTTSTLDEDKTLYAVFAKAEGVALDYTLILNKDSISTTGYSATDGNHEWMAYTVDKANRMIVSITTKDFCVNGNDIQWKKSTGTLYNTTDLGTITSITVADASNLNTYYGTTEHPTSGSLVGSGNGYFTISAGSNTGTASSITVAFTKADYTYSHYCTKVKITPTLSFAEPNYNVTMGGQFDAPTLTNEQSVTVSYSSSESGVATVNPSTGAITLVAPGTTTITASFAGNENYNEASASYTLVVAPRTFDLSVSAVGYATLCLPFNATIPAEATVYTGTYNQNGSVTLNVVADGKIKAGEGYIVANEGQHTFTETTEEVETPESNNLKGITERTLLHKDDNIYIFANQTQGVGFYKLGKDAYLAANKAYLQIPNDGTSAREFVGFGDNIETGINTIDAMPMDDGKYLKDGKIIIVKNGVKYNVNGQPLR